MVRSVAAPLAWTSTDAVKNIVSQNRVRAALNEGTLTLEEMDLDSVFQAYSSLPRLIRNAQKRSMVVGTSYLG